MKPIKLTIKGLNSFVEEQVVDFEKLTEYGLFGIFGPTGSGKSSVLDAITFALYGKVARIGESITEGIINTNSDVARVAFEFEMNTSKKKRYKVIREITRKKPPKKAVRAAQPKTETSGYTTSLVNLISLPENEVIAEKSGVDSELQKIIGLEYPDFVKTVVLPQGGFESFLKMNHGERGKVLERIFSLEKYGDILDKKIKNVKTQTQRELDKLKGAYSGYENLSESELKNKAEELEKLEEELKILERDKEAAKAQFDGLKEVFELRQKLLQLQRELAAEEENKTLMAKAEEEVKAAQRAKYLDYPMKQYEEFRLKTTEADKALKLGIEAYNLREKEAGEAELLFKTCEEELTARSPELLERQAKIKTAGEKWQSYQVIKAKLNNIENEIGVLEAELSKKAYSKLEAEAKEREVVIELEEALKSIEENKVSVEERTRITDASNLNQSIVKLEEHIKKLNRDLEARMDKLGKVEEEYRALESDEAKLFEKQKTLNEDYEIMRHSPFRIHSYYLDRKQELMKKRADREEGVKKRADLTQNELALKQTEIELSDLNAAYNELYFKYQEKIASYETYMMHQSVHLIKSRLHEGDACPVCSNIVKHLDAPTSETAEVETVLNTQKEELKALNIKLEELLKQKSTLELRQEHYARMREELEAYFDESPAFDSDMDIDWSLKQLEEDFKRFQEFNTIYLDNEKTLQVQAAELKQKMEGASTRAEDHREDIHKLTTEKDMKMDEKEAGLKKLRDLLVPYNKSPEVLIKELNEKEEAMHKALDTRQQLEKKRDEIKREIEKNEIDQQSMKVQKASLGGTKTQLEETMKEDAFYLIQTLGELRDPSSDLSKVEAEILRLNNAKEVAEKNYNLSLNQLREAKVNHQLLENELEGSRKHLEDARRNLIEKLEEQSIRDFSGITEAKIDIELLAAMEEVSAAKLSDLEMEARTKAIAHHRDTLSKKQGEIEIVTKSLGLRTVTTEEFQNAEEGLKELEQSYLKKRDNLSEERTDYKTKKENWERAKELMIQIEELNKRYDLIDKLDKVTASKAFATFIAQKQLRYVTNEATSILSNITSGNYGLVLAEAGDFKIMDYKNGSKLRAVNTLSGGETFVVSLSLALALSKQIQFKNSASLEFFFLDEGFGTLDKELLDVVMDSLESLQHEKRKIGLISHVEELKQRIPVKLIVSPAEQGGGGSKVRVE